MLHHVSGYDAFGESTGGTGSTANKYLFAGEEYDAGLGDYYLRQRFYDSDSGRFIRKDDYEGDSSNPLTLHKYIYAQNNPTTFFDPSGLSVLNFDRGSEINNEIGKEFIWYDPDFREYDRRRTPKFNPFLGHNDGSIQLSLSYIIRRATGIESDPGWPGLNKMSPDLVDFRASQIYEIKSSNYIGEGLAELVVYLNLLNAVPNMPEKWNYGSNFVPSPFLITSGGDIVRVHPPIFGVITYDILSDWIHTAAVIGVSIAAMQSNILQSQLGLAAFISRY